MPNKLVVPTPSGDQTFEFDTDVPSAEILAQARAAVIGDGSRYVPDPDSAGPPPIQAGKMGGRAAVKREQVNQGLAAVNAGADARYRANVARYGQQGADILAQQDKANTDAYYRGVRQSRMTDAGANLAGLAGGAAAGMLLPQGGPVGPALAKGGLRAATGMLAKNMAPEAVSTLSAAGTQYAIGELRRTGILPPDLETLAGTPSGNRALASAVLDVASGVAFGAATKTGRKLTRSLLGIDPATAAGDIASASRYGIDLSIRNVAGNSRIPGLREFNPVDIWQKAASIFLFASRPFRRSERTQLGQARRALDQFEVDWAPTASTAMARALRGTDPASVAKRLYNSRNNYVGSFYEMGGRDLNAARDLAKARGSLFTTNNLRKQYGEYATDLADRSIKRQVTDTAQTRTVREVERSDVRSLLKEVQNQSKVETLAKGEAEDILSGDGPVPFERSMSVDRRAQGGSAAESSSLASSKSESTTKTERSYWEEILPIDDESAVAKVIDQIGGTPEIVSFAQFDTILKNVKTAINKANPNQQRILMQFKNALEMDLEQMPDTEVRNLYKSGTSNWAFAANLDDQPIASLFAPKADGTQKFTRELLLEKMFEHPEFFSQESLTQLRSQVPKEDFKDAIQTYLTSRLRLGRSGEATEKAFNFERMRQALYLDGAAPAKKNALDHAMKLAGVTGSLDDYGTLLKVLEEKVGPQLPDLAQQLVRSATLGGATSLRRKLLPETFKTGAKGAAAATAAAAINVPGVIATVASLNMMGRYLTSEKRLKLLIGATVDGRISDSSRRILYERLVNQIAQDWVEDGTGPQAVDEAQAAIEEVLGHTQWMDQAIRSKTTGGINAVRERIRERMQ